MIIWLRMVNIAFVYKIISHCFITVVSNVALHVVYLRQFSVANQGPKMQKSAHTLYFVVLCTP